MDLRGRCRSTAPGHRRRTATRAAAAALVLASVAAAVAVAVAGCSSGGDGDREGATSVPSSTAKTGTDDATGAVVIAHRGASAYAPEHTFAAYDLARTQGADFLEQDLQLTADGVLVVLHDATLDRTARGPAESCTGLVSEKTLAQIKECDVGSWFNAANPEQADPAYVGLRIPTLEQVLDRYGKDVRYYIEIKALTAGSSMGDLLVDQLAKAELLDASAGSRRVLVQSFGPDVLKAVHAQRPELPLVQLLPDTGTPIDPAMLDTVREYAVAIGPASSSVDAALVEAAHERCLDVHPYTVDDPAEMTRLLRAGVDGMFTNQPDVLRTELDRLPVPPEHCTPTTGGAR